MIVRHLIVIILLSSGCVFTESREVPGALGFVPTVDGGADASEQDADLDATDVDATVVDPPDVDLPDLPDPPDMDRPDMPMTCGGPRDSVPSGGEKCVANVDEPSSPCDLVTQEGCMVGQRCQVALTANGPVVGCGPLPVCNFTAVGQLCANTTNQVFPPCEPGFFCPAIRAPETQSFCKAYCVLATGEGCAEAQSCAASPGVATFGYGECVPVCPIPI